MNPLLDFSGLPHFSSIKPEHISPAVDQLLAENRALIVELTKPETPATWEAVCEPLNDASERLSRAWGQVGHLHGVLDSPELREAYNTNLPKITEYSTELGQNLALFEKYKAIAASGEYATLTPAQKKVIDNEIRDFRLSGAELPEDKKPRYAEIDAELAELSTRFSENVLDATNAFSYLIEDEARLAGLPDDVKQAAREAAEKDGKPGWKFTLHAPSYFPVLQYADDRAFRETMYRESATRASEFGKPELDNTSLIAKILKLRAEQSLLLGYKNYAEVSLVPKMARTAEEVLGFLEDLGRKARPFAEKDYAELKEFGARELGLTDLQAWDNTYASEKLRAARYAFSDQEVKEYFPEPVVLEGLFRVIETIYNVRIKPDQAETWDSAVRFFRIEDSSSKLIGQFYIDLYARETKRGGAWMDDAITRRRKGDDIQTPVAYLTCNFAAPVGGKPALFTHDDVITLFHEFGHGLHHLLTRVEELGVSGINGVEWDAVELPSQFMENFCWEWEVLSHMTRHMETGEALPRTLYDKMIAAKNFQSGLATLRQIEFSLFDMHLHYDFDPNSGRTALQLLEELRSRIAVIIPPAYNRFPNNFSHIFSGGYSAGYYSYKWAEVLSADAYGAFEEHAQQAGRSVLDPEIGSRFRDEILAVGGSRPAIESFRSFRGREPKVDALLRHSGMISG